MSDDTEKRTRKPLGLKRAVDAGEVKQTFSHGRTNKVAVEVKRRRKLVKPGETPAPEAAPAPAPAPAPEPAPEPVAKKPAPAKAPVRAPAGETPQERVARLQREAVEERLRLAEVARKRDEERARKEAEEAKRREEDNRKAREEAEKRAAEEAKAAAEAPAEEPETEEADSSGGDGPAPAPRKFTPVARPEPKRPEKKKKDDKRAPKEETGGGGKDKLRSGKLTVTKALNEDEGRRARSLAALKRAREKERRMQGGGSSKQREKQVRDVVVPEAITVGELAKRMGEKGADLVKELFNLDMMVTVNQTIDQDTAELLVEQFGHNITKVSESDVDIQTEEDVDPEETLRPRPPVVTIMGHVDHGKTSLLDAIRSAKVAQGEAGGITQHIGAYQVEKDGSLITFIDTPGHEAFTSMRARGAQATDIAILVVAADDAVMPQTIESINHAKAAGVPIIVAINKVDKPAADPQRVRTQLLQHEVFVETLGGETLDVEVSAKTGQGLDRLLETILLQAEVLELRANPNRPAEGVVIEAELDKGRGPVATVLVKNGTLRMGDIIVAGNEWGRVRALLNDRGETLQEAPPSLPVEILGMSGTPMAGDRVAVVENEARAREISEYRQRKAREKAIARQAGSRGSLEQMMSQLQSTDMREAAVVVKADVGGSAEAISQALDKIGTDEVRARVIHSGVGGITESDVALAAASNAPILAFNVRASKQAKDAAEREGIEIRYYSIIYDLVDDMKGVLSGMLAPERRETFLGYAEILQVFNVTKVGKVAGCLVTEGRVERGSGVRLLRQNVVIHEGKLSTLKRFKDEVPEVQSGMECGMAFENYQDIREGDQIECFRVEHITRKL